MSAGALSRNDTMLPDDLQHEQFLMVQARALGVDWRPAAEFTRHALLTCAELALVDAPAAARAARCLTHVEPLAWAREEDGAARLQLLMYAPQGGIEAAEREHLDRALALFAELEAMALEVHLIRDDGEVAALGESPG